MKGFVIYQSIWGQKKWASLTHFKRIVYRENLLAGFGNGKNHVSSTGLAAIHRLIGKFDELEL